MSKIYRSTAFIMIISVLALAIISGCDESQKQGDQPAVKTASPANISLEKCKAVAAENIRLKELITKKEKEIAVLLKRQDDLKAKMAEMKIEHEKEISAVDDGILEIFDESIQLKEENKKLTEELNKLKGN